MRALFKKIGINDTDEIDNETMEFIIDFVERHGGLDALAKEDRGKDRNNRKYVT